MRSLAISISLAFMAGSAPAQAPASADLWRVATASLAVPPALQLGPTAGFWNPAAGPAPARLAAGIQIIQTPDVLGLSGVLAGVTGALGPVFRLGLTLGRMEVRDLVRTTTSPSSESGTIPVYTQFAAAAAGLFAARARLGAAVRVHDSRFDVDRTGGVTLDVGVRFAATDRLSLAAASHFFPIDFSSRHTTDYYAGIEYEIIREASLRGLQTRLVGRYGTTLANGGDWEHAIGAGLTLEHHLHVDLSLLRESAFGQHPWRPGVGIALEIGRYLVGIARSSGLNDVGSTYRIGLDVGILR